MTIRTLLPLALGGIALLGCEGTEDPTTGGMILHVSIGPGGSSAFDSLRVHLQGPHTETMTLPPQTTLTFDRLTPGTYTITLEGFAAGAVDHFGDNRVAVFAGRTTTSALTMSLFQTTLDPLPDSAVGQELLVSYARLPTARGYIVEWTTDSLFGSGIGIATDTLTNIAIPVPDYGRYYARVRPVDLFQEQGAASVSGSTRLYHIIFTALSAGGGYTCGTTTAGALYCWGGNSYGALGVGDTIFRTRPEPVLGGLKFSTVSASEVSTCGTTPAGVAYCWGLNASGEIGVGDTMRRTSPALVAGGLVFGVVSAGGYHTCGIASGGTAYCWGSNVLGQVGDGTRTIRLTPVAVSGGLTFASLSAGSYHNCALSTGGAAYCWGNDTIHLTPVPVPGGTPFATVSAGGAHDCGLTAGGAVYCWGYNFFGELGDGTTNGHVAPMRIADTSLTFVAVSAGHYFTCATTTSGAAYCWGTNESGELGNGSNSRFTTSPVPVSGGLTFASVDAGIAHACGLTAEGTAYCWGFGDLGNGTRNQSSVPVRVFQ